VLSHVAIKVAELDVALTETSWDTERANAGYDVAISYDGVVSYLPRKVSEWAKLAYDPQIDGWRGLAGMNDNDMPFLDIAKLIWRLFGPDAPARELELREGRNGTVTLVAVDEGPQLVIDVDNPTQRGDWGPGCTPEPVQVDVDGTE
jgi:hypothetical protein